MQNQPFIDQAGGKCESPIIRKGRGNKSHHLLPSSSGNCSHVSLKTKLPVIQISDLQGHRFLEEQYRSGLLRSAVRYHVIANKHLQFYEATNSCCHGTVRSSGVPVCDCQQHRGLAFDLVPFGVQLPAELQFQCVCLNLPASVCGCEDLSEAALDKCDASGVGTWRKQTLLFN